MSHRASPLLIAVTYIPKILFCSATYGSIPANLHTVFNYLLGKLLIIDKLCNIQQQCAKDNKHAHSRQQRMFCKSTKMRATAVKCSKRTRSFEKKHSSTSKTNIYFKLRKPYDGYFTETSLKFTELKRLHVAHQLVNSLSWEHNFQRNEARHFSHVFTSL